MKPPPVAYHRPATEEEALDLLQRYGDDARILAGGQSLVPLLNFRLARPGHLVDVTRIASVSYIRARAGRLLIGAATRQAALERSSLIAGRWPLLRKAIDHVGHPQTRSRGTVGGSIAHADPAAELPVALAALDGLVHLASARGKRTVSWNDFFHSEFVTACEADEMVTGVEIPPARDGTGTSFREYAARHGDFAVGGAAAVISIDRQGRCRWASLALLACGPRPVRAVDAERALIGNTVTREAAAEASELALGTAEFRSGHTDVPTEYRRHVMRGLVEDAVLEAVRNATPALDGDVRS